MNRTLPSRVRIVPCAALDRSLEAASARRLTFDGDEVGHFGVEGSS